MRYPPQEFQEARAKLRKLLPKDGARVYCIRRKRTDMSNWISLYAIKYGSPIPITLNAARVTGYRANDGRPWWAIRVRGAGVDPCVEAVDGLSRAIGRHLVCEEI